MLKKIVFLIVIALLASCSGMGSNFQKPEVKVVSISPSDNKNGSFKQSFNIGLEIMNPNSRALNLAGMSYRIQIDGFSVLSGVAKDIPTIAGYSQETVNVNTSISILEGLRFINSLISKSSSSLNYRMTATIDTGVPFIGAVPIINAGKIDLSNFSK